MVYCENCGAEMSSNANFCPHYIDEEDKTLTLIITVGDYTLSFTDD